MPCFCTRRCFMQAHQGRGLTFKQGTSRALHVPLLLLLTHGAGCGQLLLDSSIDGGSVLRRRKYERRLGCVSMRTYHVHVSRLKHPLRRRQLFKVQLFQALTAAQLEHKTQQVEQSLPKLWFNVQRNLRSICFKQGKRHEVFGHHLYRNARGPQLSTYVGLHASAAKQTNS